MNKKKFLKKYLNATSPTGLETAGQQIWLDYIRPYVDETFTDIYGTAVGVVNPGSDYRVVIEAHADEIGWTVNHIDSQGYIRVVRNGGSDHQIAPGMKVQILGDNGIVKGKFGWPAIHERKGPGAITPEVDKLFVDVGAKSKEEVEQMGIFVGTPMVYDTKFSYENKEYTSRALDNRIGGYMIAQVAKRLKDKGKKLPYTLFIVNAVQEEIGLCGAKMIAQTIKPDVAIVTDVCHNTDTPHLNKMRAGDTSGGKGPVLFRGADIQLNLHKQVLDVAKKKDIPFQRGTYNGNSGTDTREFYLAGGGCACQLISLPLKYMHTNVETVYKKDVKSVIKLIYHSLLSIEEGQDFRYIKEGDHKKWRR